MTRSSILAASVLLGTLVHPAAILAALEKEAITVATLIGVLVGELTGSSGTAYPVTLAYTAALSKWLFVYYSYRHRVFFRV